MPKCDVCGREFATETALAQHMKDKHGTTVTPSESKRESSDRKSGKRKSLRRRNYHPRALVAVGAILVVLVGLYFVVVPFVTNPYPISCATSESVVYHVHPYLVIDIEGNNVSIPADIGIKIVGGVQQCLVPIHTHDSSGIIHIESPTNTNYSLGLFFTIWMDTYSTVSFNGTSHPVEFTSTDILGYQADSTHQVVLLVDGKVSAAGPSLSLTQLDYCSAASTTAPCSPTATGDPEWNGSVGGYPYGTGHTVVIEYLAG